MLIRVGLGWFIDVLRAVFGVSFGKSFLFVAALRLSWTCSLLLLLRVEALWWSWYEVVGEGCVVEFGDAYDVR